MTETTKRTWFQRVTEVIRDEPLNALLLATIGATFVYFFVVVSLFVPGIFVNGAYSVAAWAWQAWNPGANQDHSKLVPLIFLGLILYHRKEIARAPKAGSNNGLVCVGIVIFLFVLSARCL